MINSEWIGNFNRKVVAERIPVSGMIELTRRCNLRCIHCYLGDGDDRFGDGEMTTKQVLDVIDQIAEAGCLYLTITGGDPMMRRDFPAVYRHAKEAGLLVTVMCDGVLVSPEIVELFKDLPPTAVEISLYGGSAKIYEKVTRIPGSFARCLQGISRLVEAGLKVRIKTVLMSVNAHEIEAMRAIAEGFGSPLRLDSAIFPCLHTEDRGPVDLRVPPEEVVRIEMADPETVKSWLDFLEKPAPLVDKDRLYVCGAGVKSFFVDSHGFVSPCVMTTRYRHNLLETNFRTLWSENLGELHDTKFRVGYECASCDLLRACSSCPGFHDHEHGAEDIKSEYVCETAKIRWRALQDPKLRAAAQALKELEQ